MAWLPARRSFAPLKAWHLLLGRAGRVGLVVLVGLGLARVPLGWGVLLAAGGAAALAILRWPALGFIPLAFGIPFGAARAFLLGGFSVSLSQPLLAVISAAWAARRTALGEGRIRRLPLTMPLLVFWGVISLGLLPAQDLSSALTEWLKWAEVLWVYLLVGSIVGPSERLGLLGALCAAGALEAALGLYQFLFQVGPAGFILFGRYMRAYGTFRQPNPFGGYLGLLLPLGYASVWAGARRALSRRAPLKERVLWGLALGASLLMALGIVASWSRGALVGVLGGLALVALRLGRRTWFILLILALLIGILAPALLGALPAGFIERLGDAFALIGQDLSTVEITDANFALVERYAHWQAAWRMFAQHPWFGVGVGQYPAVYPSVAVPRWQDPLGHAHNYYLNILAEGGLVGLGAYCALMLATLITLWRRSGKASGWERALALGALGMWGHLMAHSLFDNLYVHEMYLLVAIVLAMAAPWPSERA